MAETTRDAVAHFIAARRARPAWSPPPAHFGPADIEAGYHLQRDIHATLDRGGDRRLGYKVGASSRPGQRAWGLDEPVYAGIFATTQHDTLAAALATPLADPALECEVAIQLCADLDATARPPTRADAAAAIGTVHLACEIIDRRCGPPDAALVPTYLADDFFHAAFVLGPALPDPQGVDFAQLAGSITVGERTTKGVPGEALDPLAALIWLAAALARYGRKLQRREIVLTGTLVDAVPVHPPDEPITLAIPGFPPLNS